MMGLKRDILQMACKKDAPIAKTVQSKRTENAKGFSDISVQIAAKISPQIDDQADSKKLSFKTILTTDIHYLN